MRKSIRAKLFMGVSGLIVFFVFMSWVLNTGYLGKYYMSQKKKNLVESYNMIDRIYKGDPLDISLELERLERTTGLSIVIMSQSYQIKYDSRSLRQPGGVDLRGDSDAKKRYPLEAFPTRLSPSSLSHAQYTINTSKDSRLNTNFLTLYSLLNGGEYIILSTPLAAIQESAAIANNFFIFTGIITIIIGFIVAYIFSRKFTHPILELNEIAYRMSKLDFSKKYYVTSNDEIGELGKAINSLSNQLDKSISELKQANQELTEDIERERKIDEMRKEFISSVSHELKTPITLIQGYAEGLKVNVIDDEANKNFYCDVIVDEANKMNKLVRELLDLSQIDSGGFKLEKSIFDISTLISSVLKKYEPVFKEKGVEISIENMHHIDVDADMVRIEQVLLNYLNNAVNHIDNKKIIKISIHTYTQKVIVSVFNSGNHIYEKEMDKIWLSFYKVDKARTRAYGGIGLGLSIVRAIMQLHKCRFGAKNIQDGVEFWFELDKVNC